MYRHSSFIYYLFYSSHPSGYEMVSHFDLIHISLMAKDWVAFHTLTGHLCNVFGKMCIWALCPFLNWVIYLFVMSSLYILGIRLLSEIWFVSIFSHSVNCLFTSLMVLFTVQVFIFDKVLFMFPLVAYTLGVLSMKALPNPNSKIYSCLLLRIL